MQDVFCMPVQCAKLIAVEALHSAALVLKVLTGALRVKYASSVP